jgi:predicted nucleic acid-binding protein
MNNVVIDTNVLVALVDSRDKWHNKARDLLEVLELHEAQVMYLDCVLNETISVLARRSEEQKRIEEFIFLLETALYQAPESSIVWASLQTYRLYDEIVALIKQTQGALNFHDVLIALLCREWEVPFLLSFDKDFDTIPWFRRIETAQDIADALTKSSD